MTPLRMEETNDNIINLGGSTILSPLSASFILMVMTIRRSAFHRHHYLLFTSLFINFVSSWSPTTILKPIHHLSMTTIDASNADLGHSDPGSLLLSHVHKFELTSDESTTSSPPNLRLIFASQSPRRREILDLMGLSGRYITQPSPLYEEALQIEMAKRKDYTPQCYALELAERKAHAMAITLLPQNKNKNNNNNDPDGNITLVIGSDTIVDLEGEIMNKPTNEADAFNMLKKLSGKWHKVHTGVAIYVVGAKHIFGHDEFLIESHTDTASVKFANLTDSDIHAYIATKEPMDKAGSYGIQGVGGQFVERLEGDYFTIMGLSMHRLGKGLAQTIRELGI